MPSELSVSSFIAGAVTALFCLLCFACVNFAWPNKGFTHAFVAIGLRAGVPKKAYVVFALGFFCYYFFIAAVGRLV